MVISVIPANDNYTKNNPKNEVVYDKEKDPSQGTSGSMVPSVLNDKPFATIIPNPDEKVNASGEKYLKAAQTAVGIERHDNRYFFDGNKKDRGR